MADSSKIAELFVEISGDLRKYYDATAKAKSLTRDTGQAMTSTMADAGSRSGNALAAALAAAGGRITATFDALGGHVTVAFAGAGAEAAAGFARPFDEAGRKVSAAVVPPAPHGPWSKAGSDASQAFADAFRSVGRMILRKLLIFGGATALAAAFAMHGSKTAQAFSNAFAAVARGIRSPLGKAIAGASVVAIFAAAGAKAAMAFTRALASTAASATGRVVHAFASVGKAAAGALKSAAHGVLGSSLAQGLLGGVGFGAGMAGFGVLTGGIETAVGAIKSAILGASNLNETLSKVKTTFHGATNIVTAGADEMARKFGVPKREFLDAASAIGLIGKGAKLTDAQAAKLGVDMAKLGADSASFYNVPIEEALEKIRAGLVGESEPLRAFGVLLNEAAVNSEALRLKLVRSKAEITDGIKVQARASLIMQGLATASGDLERTQDSLANRLREIRGRFEDLATQVGQYFLPAAEAASRVVSELIQSVAGKLGAGSSLFASWGESLRKAAEFAGILFRNLDKAKEYGGALFKDFAARISEAFGTLANNLMNFADYFAKEIGIRIEMAMVKTINAITEAFGFGHAIPEKRREDFGGNPRPNFEAIPEHIKAPELAKIEKDLVQGEAAFQFGKRAVEGVKRVILDAAAQAKAIAAQEEGMRTEAAKDRAVVENNAARAQGMRGLPANGRGTGVFAGAMAGAGTKLDKAASKLNDVEAKLREAAQGNGPGAEEAKEQLKGLDDFRQQQKKGGLLADAQAAREKSGQTFGLEEFQKEIQRSAFGGAGDPAEKTATATGKMAEILELLKGNGLKITGNMVAVAT